MKLLNFPPRRMTWVEGLSASTDLLCAALDRFTVRLQRLRLQLWADRLRIAWQAFLLVLVALAIGVFAATLWLSI